MDIGLEVAIQSIYDEDNKVEKYDKLIPWFKAENVHWYIIRGQYTMEAFRELANEHPQGSHECQILFEFEVIMVLNNKTAFANPSFQCIEFEHYR